MITNWNISNFKSIEKNKDFELRPLTIFAGANSSGKSTVLQSILLITQTIQNPIKSRSVILNGHISKFGSYQDIVTNRDLAKKIKLGFKIKPNDKMRKQRFFSPFNEDFDSLSCHLEISAGNELECLQPILENVTITTKDSNSKETKISAHKSNKDVETRIRELKLSDCSIANKDVFEYEISSSNKRLRHFMQHSVGKITYVGVNFSHFLPEYMIGYYNKKEVFINYFSNLFSGNNMFFDEDELKCYWSETLIKSIYAFIDNIDISTLDPKQKAQYEAKIKSINKKFTANKLKKIIIESQQQLNIIENQLIKEELERLPNSFQVENYPLYYHSDINFINDFFRNSIKYLGPLRDEPKSIYPLESFNSSTDVGFKGENTAAVLEYNKSQKIDYISPLSFYDKEETNQFQVKSGNLIEAIHEWLIYLGIANDIQTSDKGKFGHELKISTDNPNLQQDLTHVGVGVSQVLPILVLSFLAEEDSTLIFEQPELHLHPRVQTRLADFFVSMNKLGKQCIVETHSEYLINRLRYLVAKSDNDKISNESIIYFVEKENGQSIYRPIKINRYGVIEEWPKGFFDESESIASEILKAGMTKRKNERK